MVATTPLSGQAYAPRTASLLRSAECSKAWRLNAGRCRSMSCPGRPSRTRGSGGTASLWISCLSSVGRSRNVVVFFNIVVEESSLVPWHLSMLLLLILQCHAYGSDVARRALVVGSEHIREAVVRHGLVFLRESCIQWPLDLSIDCLLYTSPSPRDGLLSRMPSSA